MSALYGVCHDAGGMTAYEWERDPKRLGFILARYKFVAKMLAGMGHVLEVGCADGWGSRVVRQSVGALTAIDLDQRSIEEAEKNASRVWPIRFEVANALDAFLYGPFDAVYSLDVLEHIHPVDEQQFLENVRSAAPVAIFGTPSIESQEFASELSKRGHVNCKTEAELRDTLRRHWGNVFLFGMNDETLHTGFGPMCHYRLALCVG